MSSIAEAQSIERSSICDSGRLLEALASAGDRLAPLRVPRLSRLRPLCRPAARDAPSDSGGVAPLSRSVIARMGRSDSSPRHDRRLLSLSHWLPERALARSGLDEASLGHASILADRAGGQLPDGTSCRASPWDAGSPTRPADAVWAFALQPSPLSQGPSPHPLRRCNDVAAPASPSRRTDVERVPFPVIDYRSATLHDSPGGVLPLD